MIRTIIFFVCIASAAFGGYQHGIMVGSLGGSPVNTSLISQLADVNGYIDANPPKAGHRAKY